MDLAPSAVGGMLTLTKSDGNLLVLVHTDDFLVRSFNHDEHSVNYK